MPVLNFWFNKILQYDSRDNHVNMLRITYDIFHKYYSTILLLFLSANILFLFYAVTMCISSVAQTVPNNDITLTIRIDEPIVPSLHKFHIRMATMWWPSTVWLMFVDTELECASVRDASRLWRLSDDQWIQRSRFRCAVGKAARSDKQPPRLMQRRPISVRNALVYPLERCLARQCGQLGCNNDK